MFSGYVENATDVENESCSHRLEWQVWSSAPRLLRCVTVLEEPSEMETRSAGIAGSCNRPGIARASRRSAYGR